ncbi:MAG: PAS domain S-box protein [Halobacteriales archaeon]|nr:PAS domain S-box protein [Halobacteriales archaeon]
MNENVTKDGEKVVCEWHNRVITDESDETMAVFSQFHDVTDEKEYERELLRYRQMVNSMHEAAC